MICLVFEVGYQGVEFCIHLDKLQKPEKENVIVGHFRSMSDLFFFALFLDGKRVTLLHPPQPIQAVVGLIFL